MTAPRSAYGSMVQEYQLAKVRQFAASRRATIDGISSTSEAQGYRRLVKARLKRCFGAMPKRVPLNAKITGTVERPTYTIEKVMFQSRENYWVTANLYLPKNASAKNRCPGVAVSCGHAGEGKAFTNYQNVARILAHQGFVSLIFDPVGQGERHQYLAESKYLGPVGEHQVAGNQMSLLGEFFGSWRAWDGIVAIDYLCSRPEVDTRHIGMTGNSGGGTLTTFISMLDDRVTMAAASCLGSDYLTNVENELACDSEQNPPGVISSELNYADFFIAQAPRPTIILAAKEDFFDLRGLDQIHEDHKKICGLLGKKSHARIHRGEGGHGYSPELREAMCRFFREMVGMEPGYSEPATEPETLKTLQVTPKGQVTAIKGTKRIFDFTSAAADAAAQSRRKVAVKDMPRVLGKLLKLPTRKGVAHYRTLRALPDRMNQKTRVYRWGIETEPNIMAILQARVGVGAAYYGRLPAPQSMSLYLPHISSSEDQAQGHFKVGKEPAFTLDVRGIGEMRSWVCGGDEDFFLPYDSDFFHAMQHQMMNESYLGMRVHDVLVTLDLLASKGTTELHLIGRGLGGVIGAFAAAIHPLVTRVTLKNVPKSFHALTQTPVQQWPVSSLPWGILQVTDLPEIYEQLRKSKGLKITSPWTAQMGKDVKKKPVKK